MNRLLTNMPSSPKYSDDVQFCVLAPIVAGSGTTKSSPLGGRPWTSAKPPRRHSASRLASMGWDERAAAMASLAGGTEGLQPAAREALEHEKYEWAAELATHLIRLEPSANAKHIKADALRALSRRQVNSNARNYYLTQALELEGKVEVRDQTKPENTLSFVSTVPIRRFVAAMPVNLIYEKSADKEMLVGFRFPDVDEGYGIEIRRGVAEFKDTFPENPDLTITAGSMVWRELVLGLRSPVKAFASGDVKFDGSALDLVGFLRLFRPPNR